VLDGTVIVAVKVVVVFTGFAVSHHCVVEFDPVSARGPVVKLPPTVQPLGTSIAALATLPEPVMVNTTLKEDDVPPAFRLSEDILHVNKLDAAREWQPLQD